MREGRLAHGLYMLCVLCIVCYGYSSDHAANVYVYVHVCLLVSFVWAAGCCT